MRSDLNSQSQDAKEEIVQAAYICNFAFFMDWPAPAFKGPHDPVVIGVAGRNSMINIISDGVKNKTVRGRKFEVVRINSVADAKRTHILYVGFSEMPRIEEYLSALRSSPVVTVGDEQQFNAKGGMIRFFTEDDRLRFEINLEAVGTSKVEIQAKLFSMAKVSK